MWLAACVEVEGECANRKEAVREGGATGCASTGRGRKVGPIAHLEVPGVQEEEVELDVDMGVGLLQLL